MIPASWRAYRPPKVDVGIAVAFAVVGQLVTWGQFEEPESFAGPRGMNAVISLLLMAALAWRRRAPLAAVTWAVTVYLLSLAVLAHDVTFLAGALPIFVLTASAAYYCPRRRAVLAAAFVLTGMVVMTLTTPFLSGLDSFLANGVFVLAAWLAARGLREREDRAAALGAALASERAGQEAALREVVASERVRLARELHDIVAHSVSVMVIQVGAARMQLPAGATDSEASLRAAEELGRQALAELRRLLGVLRADEPADEEPWEEPQPPQPGLSEIDGLIRQTESAGLRVEKRVEGAPVDVPPGLDLTAYRIVQEALTNTLKHSGAANATVLVRYGRSSLVVDVIDDGVRTTMVEGNGHGLVGINERVSLFGGTATAGPVPGGGWRVHAELPLLAAPREGQRVGSPRAS